MTWKDINCKENKESIFPVLNRIWREVSLGEEVVQMPAVVNCGQVNINSMSNDALIASGQNSQPEWNFQGKWNIGNGLHAGLVLTSAIFNVIYDSDVVDAPAVQPEGVNPVPTSQV